MMKLKRISIDNWSAIFNKSGSSNYFQSPEWLNLQSKIFKLNNLFYEVSILGSKKYISFQERDGNLFSGFIGYGGFIAREGETMDLNLVRELINIINKKEKLNINRIKLYPLLNYLGSKDEFLIDHTSILEIENSILTQEEKINKKNRNLIRKALKSNVRIKKIQSKDVAIFYKFYKVTMKRVGSSYLTPIELFKEFSRTKNVDFLGAYLNNVLIAGSVFMKYNDVMYYWWNSSSDKGRMVDANYLLIFEALKIAIAERIKFLDMASSHSVNIEIPKLKWGSKRVPLYIFEK